MAASFQESEQYKPKDVQQNNSLAPSDKPGIEEKLLDFVRGNSHQNDPVSVCQAIDQFCKENWMMNLGPEKGEIIRDRFKTIQPKTIL